ncbi:hypothetical protein [Streptomyces sp. KN37]|nr:hypothetical protein [Streptomyces sp. KN37]WPO76737.1 hypothetical protein R9806_39645 [Streptomyces sp. KN37]
MADEIEHYWAAGVEAGGVGAVAQARASTLARFGFSVVHPSGLL